MGRVRSGSELAIIEVIAQNIRTIRIGQGLTQERLAQMAGLSRTSVTNIEVGNQGVSVHHLMAFAMALRVDVQTLLPGYAPSAPKSELRSLRVENSRLRRALARARGIISAALDTEEPT